MLGVQQQEELLNFVELVFSKLTLDPDALLSKQPTDCCLG